MDWETAYENRLMNAYEDSQREDESEDIEKREMERAEDIFYSEMGM